MINGNLKPVGSEQEARELGRRGGIASGKARREKRRLRDELLILLAYENADGSGAARIATALFDKALAGDVKAFEVIRDSIGEKPVDQKEISGTFDVVNALEEARKRASRRDVRAEDQNPDKA